MWYAAVLWDEKILATAFSLGERDALHSLLKSLPYNVPFQAAEKLSQLSMELLKTLTSIFNGRDISFSFNVTMDHLSSYTQGVLKCVSRVPIGYVTTYNAIAESVGGSPRAVGQVMAANPFPLLIPCHRVVRADFSISGYGLGEKSSESFFKGRIEDMKRRQS